MIDGRTSYLPIAVFDDETDWDDLLDLCPDHLDDDGLDRLRSAERAKLKFPSL